ncbi:MAG: hypothetical protein ACFFCW_21485 [Candidatus Hodarchaeota archaeon]
MTHTLHRRGDIDSLREDYVILILQAKGVNREGGEEKIRQVWDVLSHYKGEIINFGNSKDGNSFRTTMEALKKEAVGYIAHAVFREPETLKACLKELKDRDFGISVVISGLYQDAEKICSEIGLCPHTVEHSLGIHGKTEILPHENILEITTMCGHAMVSPNLVTHLVAEINSGKISCEEAAKEMSGMCDCGIFNHYRAEKLLRKMTTEE